MMEIMGDGVFILLLPICFHLEVRCLLLVSGAGNSKEGDSLCSGALY
jgi:hypothetical protein